MRWAGCDENGDAGWERTEWDFKQFWMEGRTGSALLHPAVFRGTPGMGVGITSVMTLRTQSHAGEFSEPLVDKVS